MPMVSVDGVSLYLEIHGEGPNLVLIQGQGYHTGMWYGQIPIFERYFRTLAYDSRGVGRSDAPPGPYDHAQNADDLAAILDHLGWARTHVLGMSMGGFIALQFAIRHPERLNRLVLVATGFGGPNMVPVPPDALRALMPNPELPVEERVRSAMPIAFGDPGWVDNHGDEFDQIVRRRLELPQAAEAAIAQAQAGLAFNVEDRLGEIRAPTLVISGTRDRVVPCRNAELLAERIRGAKLDMIDGAGHLVFIEEPERFNGDVIRFLGGEQL